MRLLKRTREHAHIPASANDHARASSVFSPPLDGAATAAVDGHHGFYRGGVPDLRHGALACDRHGPAALATPALRAGNAAARCGASESALYFHIRPDRRG